MFPVIRPRTYHGVVTSPKSSPCRSDALSRKHHSPSRSARMIPVLAESLQNLRAEIRVASGNPRAPGESLHSFTLARHYF